MIYQVKCNTIGELRKAIEHWPNNKPLILDLAGNTYLVEIYEWHDDANSSDTEWPAAINANV